MNTVIKGAAGSPGERDARTASTSSARTAPIVAGVDSSAASRVAIDMAVRLGSDLGAPVVFVHVRRGPAGFLGTPGYQRRLTKEMTHARHVLDHALAIATRAGVPAEGEILEGAPQRRIAEFARDRSAQVVVVGSRKWRFGRSVSSGVQRASQRPVVVARGVQRPAMAS